MDHFPVRYVGHNQLVAIDSDPIWQRDHRRSSWEITESVGKMTKIVLGSLKQIQDPHRNIWVNDVATSLRPHWNHGL
jgi:hypothetical protein